MSDLNLAKHNIKFIQYAGFIVVISLVSLIFNIVFYPFEHVSVILGLLVGVVWGFYCPKVWKNESSVINILITFGLIIPASVYLTGQYGLHASFQMLSALLLSASFIWFIQKDKLIKFLTVKGS